MNGLAERGDVREQMRVYMGRTSRTLADIAFDIGYSRRTLMQFVSRAEFGTAAEGGETTQRIAAWLSANQPPLREFPGAKIYETGATREIDEMIDYGREGGWGTIYGAAGAQKTFRLEWRAAEAEREGAGDIALVGCDARLTPRGLLRMIAAEVHASYADSAEDTKRAILGAIARRAKPLALILDEAQLLYREIDTLITLRRLGDNARGKLGIVVCGNEEVLRLFEPRRRTYFEQWRSRIEQRSVRVLGPTRAEAMRMIAGELGAIAESAKEVLLKCCTVKDPVSGREYVNARRLFNAIKSFRRERAAKTN